MKRILNYNKFFLKESFYNIKTSYDYEWVKTTTLWKYREFDRSEYNDKIENLKNILSTQKFNQPLILQYSHKYKTAYLIEGNHRLLAALQLGIEYVPVTVTIDGYERKNTHKVIGYYSQDEKVEPKLPSEIGIPDCLDKIGNPVNSEYRTFEENEVDYDKVLLNYPDIDHFEKVEEGCYTIWVKMKWWNINIFMNSNFFDNIENALDNNMNEFFKNNLHDNNVIDYLDGDYFTKDMKKILNLKENINYEDEFNYFWDIFVDTNYYKKYLSEVKRIIWEKYKKENINTFVNGSFETPYDGIIDWWYKTPNNNDLSNVNGIIIKHELLECYDNHLFDSSNFLNILKEAYNKEIGYEWKINHLIGKIKPEMLNFEYIFK